MLNSPAFVACSSVVNSPYLPSLVFDGALRGLAHRTGLIAVGLGRKSRRMRGRWPRVFIVPRSLPISRPRRSLPVLPIQSRDPAVLADAESLGQSRQLRAVGPYDLGEFIASPILGRAALPRPTGPAVGRFRTCWSIDWIIPLGVDEPGSVWANGDAARPGFASKGVCGARLCAHRSDLLKQPLGSPLDVWRLYRSDAGTPLRCRTTVTLVP